MGSIPNGVRVRLPDAPGGKKVRSGKSDGLGSPERYPSSRDAVIACVVSSQKRGVDMTRGNYDSANYMLAYSNGNCPVLKTERGCKSLWVQILPQAPRGSILADIAVSAPELSCVFCDIIRLV